MSVRPGLGRGFRRLGIAVCVLVGVVGVLDALLLQVGMSTVEAFYDTATDDATYQRQLVSLDQWSVGTMIVYALVFLAAGVCWIDWQGQLASSPRLERAGGRLRPGWHAWVWFVPMLNLVLPALAMRELDRGLGVPGRRRLRSHCGCGGSPSCSAWFSVGMPPGAPAPSRTWSARGTWTGRSISTSGASSSA